MGVDFPFLSDFCCSFWLCAVLYLFPGPLQVSGALPILSRLVAWWITWPSSVGALRLLDCPRSHVRLMYQSPRDSLRLWLEQPTVRPDSGSFHCGTPSPTPAHTDGNSKGDAAVTPALSQCFGGLAPPVMSPDVKLLIKPRPIPLEHSQLPAMFLICLSSLSHDSWIKLASSWLFVGPLLDSERRPQLCQDVKWSVDLQWLNQASGWAAVATGRATTPQEIKTGWTRNVPKRTNW